jgi:hypothetical protein
VNRKKRTRKRESERERERERAADKATQTLINFFRLLRRNVPTYYMLVVKKITRAVRFKNNDVFYKVVTALNKPHTLEQNAV